MTGLLIWLGAALVLCVITLTFSEGRAAWAWIGKLPVLGVELGLRRTARRPQMTVDEYIKLRDMERDLGLEPSEPLMPRPAALFAAVEKVQADREESARATREDEIGSCVARYEKTISEAEHLKRELDAESAR